MPGWDYETEHDSSVERPKEIISMKKILSLMLGMSFVLGTLAFAQEAGQGSSPTESMTTKKTKMSK